MGSFKHDLSYVVDILWAVLKAKREIYANVELNGYSIS